MIRKNDFTLEDLQRFRAVNINTGMIQFFVSRQSLLNFVNENKEWLIK